MWDVSAAEYYRARPNAIITAFADDFNRPDSLTVANGWLNAPSDGVHHLVILNNRLSIDPLEVGDGSENIYHPMLSPALPTTVSVKFTDKNGFGPLRGRYQSFVTLLYNPNTGKGYGVYLTHADSSVSDSRVTVFDGDTTVGSFPSSFQFAAETIVTATFLENGSITGQVQGEGNTFSFSIPPRQILSDGNAVMIGLSRASNGNPTILPTADDFSLTRP